jgi:hypothetical protein
MLISYRLRAVDTTNPETVCATLGDDICTELRKMYKNQQYTLKVQTVKGRSSKQSS